MTARWTIAIASLLLHEKTFRMQVAPAIADLQHEHASRTLPARTRDYAVIWWTIARALGRDVMDDAAAITFSEAARAVWPRVLGFYAVVFLVGTTRRITQGIRIHTPDMAPGEFNTLPLPQAGDGLEPYLAGVLISMAAISLAYATVPAVFMFRRRQVRGRAIVIGVLGLALMAYSTARLTGPVRAASSDYRTAAVMRATGLYPGNEPLAAIIDQEIQPRRESLAQHTPAGRDLEARVQASRHWTDVSFGLSVLVYAVVGAAIARGTGIGVLFRFAGIIGTRFALGFALPYLSLLIWPLYPYPASVRAFERPLLESQLAFALLPLIACVFLALPGRRRTAGHGTTMRA